MRANASIRFTNLDLCSRSELVFKFLNLNMIRSLSIHFCSASTQRPFTNNEMFCKCHLSCKFNTKSIPFKSSLFFVRILTIRCRTHEETVNYCKIKSIPFHLSHTSLELKEKKIEIQRVMLTLSYHELISEPTSSLTLQSNKIKDVEQIQK